MNKWGLSICCNVLLSKGTRMHYKKINLNVFTLDGKINLCLKDISAFGL